MALTWGRAGVVFAAFGVAAAVYYVMGDACRSSARIDALYAVPFLLGASAFFFATKGAPGWWKGLIAAVATAVVSGALLVVLAIVHYGAYGCYT